MRVSLSAAKRIHLHLALAPVSLPKQHRLSSNRDFSQIHRQGLRASTQHLAIKALSSKSELEKRPPILKSKRPRLNAPRSKAPMPQVPISNAPTAKQEITKSTDGRSSALSGTQKSASAQRSASSNAARADDSQASTGTPSKFGISISKKVSKRAVVRNRIRRQIQAVLQQRLGMIAPNWKVVIVVRPSAVECEFDDFLRELEYLLRKLSITDI